MSSKLRKSVSCLVKEIEHRNILDELGKFNRDTLKYILGGVKTALAEPLRNCDVGTPEEQTKRFQKFCLAHNDCYKCDCPCDNRDGGCQIRWGQMPFVKEGETE